MEVLPISNISLSHLYPFRRVKITNFFKIEEPELGSIYFVFLEPDLRFTPICHECGSKAEGIHSWHDRHLRDLNIFGTKCKVVYHYRKIKCPNYGIKVEKTDVTTPGDTQITNRMAEYAHQLCQYMTVKEVAEHLTYIGKHHKYLTVVLDFKTGRVIWLGKDRKTKTLKSFFSDMPESKLNQIETIAMDMWDPFIKAVRKHCPQARIIFDKYPLIASYNRDVIDEIRRSEQRKNLRDNPEYKIYKGSRWILLKNRENIPTNLEKIHKI